MLSWTREVGRFCLSFSPFISAIYHTTIHVVHPSGFFPRSGSFYKECIATPPITLRVRILTH